MLTDGLNINEKGHLTIGGCDTVELAETYGTPLYVMNEEVIRQALRAYVQSMETYYPQGGRVAYASKACCFLEMYRIAAQEGERVLEADWVVVSIGYQADDALYRQVYAATEKPVWLLGDAKKPGTIMNAIRDGSAVGALI